MTPEEKDRYICQQLGVEWHEPVKTRKGIIENRGIILCSCEIAFTNQEYIKHLKISNPSFESEAGRVQLLKLMTDKDGFWYKDEQYLDLELFMLDDDGKFRDEVFRWLGGVE